MPTLDVSHLRRHLKNADPPTTAGASSLTIPDVSKMTTLAAAQTYAAAGMYLLPTDPKKIKNPGSIVGSNWQEKSSCDPEQIAEWFEDNPERGIAWHVGRSGAIAFDLDHDQKPQDIDSEIWDALQTGAIHATRKNGSVRAHYVFACEPDQFGNSAGFFEPFGQVRCKNGVVILAPTPHPDAETKGGQYRWRDTGELPSLPDALRAGLKKAGESVEPKTPAELDKFFAAHTLYAEPQALQGHSAYFQKQVEQRSSRHDAMRETLRFGFREAIAGRVPASEVYKSLKFIFDGAKPEAKGTTEFREIACWAAAKAEQDEPPEKRNGSPGGVGDELDELDPLVANELARLKARAEAKRLFEQESHPPLVHTPLSLTDFLAQPSNPTPMRIDSVMPDAGRVVFSAPKKSGKTTVVGNLIRSLVDGDPFLDVFPVNKRAKRVVLIDNELSDHMVRDWLTDQAIVNTDAVADVICLRGRVSSFDILNNRRRAEWASILNSIGCDYLIFDCLRPVLDALGLDENHDGGKFLTAFDALLAEAGCSGDSMVVHHMGHSGERSRGDSRIEDWPDAIWKIVKEKSDDDSSPKYFSAFGRDVDVPQSKLDFNRKNRHLTYTGLSKAVAKKHDDHDKLITIAVKILAADKANGGNGMAKTQLVAAVKSSPDLNGTAVGRPKVESAIESAVSRGFIKETLGGGSNAKICSPGRVVWTAP